MNDTGMRQREAFLSNAEGRGRGTRVWSGAAAGLMILFAASSASAFDFSDWSLLLKKYVSPTTIDGVRVNGMDYRAIRKDPKFKKLIEDLKNFDPGRLTKNKEKLAFWINVYNIMAVKMVVDHYPLKSIKDVGSLFQTVWKRQVGIVGRKPVTLHEIEHEILRKMGDPRIHVAIVCASVSCPDMRKEAYAPERLNEQLDDQMKRFLENPGKGLRVDREAGKLYLSSIFKWFSEDFEPRGVRKTLARYAPPSARKMLTRADTNISYLDYNWSLNQR